MASMNDQDNSQNQPNAQTNEEEGDTTSASASEPQKPDDLTNDQLEKISAGTLRIRVVPKPPEFP